MHSEKLYLIMKTEVKKIFIVKAKVEESPTITTLSLTLEDGSFPTYRPGQFVTVYFPELGTPEGKAYSISSAPSENIFTITVKAIGLFSNKLCSMNLGDSFEASLPYGYFFSESEGSPLVLVAGGIGVTPFRAMIMETIKHFPSRKIVLLQSSKTAEDLIFKKELNAFARMNPHFRPIFFVTREQSPDPADVNRRIEIGDILGKKDQKDGEFFICGSIPFVRDIWKGLRDKGVLEENICTEAFFSH